MAAAAEASPAVAATAFAEVEAGAAAAVTEAAAADGGAAFAVGVAVECRYGGGDDYYTGRVASLHADDGSCDILYDDGDFEARVPTALIRAAAGVRFAAVAAAAAASRRVLAFGDSLTAGYWAMGREFTPYAERLQALLGGGAAAAAAAAAEAAWEVSHVGLCGWTARSMAGARELEERSSVDVCDRQWHGGLRTQLRVAREEGRPFGVLVVLAGTNDLGEVVDGLCTADEVVAALATLHAVGREAGCRVVALSVPEHGQEPQFPELARARAAINAGLRALPGALLVDTAAALPQTNRALWDDALHLSREGYELLGKTVHEKAAAVFQ